MEGWNVEPEEGEDSMLDVSDGWMLVAAGSISDASEEEESSGGTALDAFSMLVA